MVFFWPQRSFLKVIAVIKKYQKTEYLLPTLRRNKRLCFFFLIASHLFLFLMACGWKMIVFFSRVHHLLSIVFCVREGFVSFLNAFFFSLLCHGDSTRSRVLNFQFTW